LRLVSGGNTVAEESGEVLFTDYGLSGIPALQVSGAANGVDGKQINAVIDLLPQITEGDAAERLQERYKIFKDAEPEYFLTGWFHKRIGQALLREIKLMPSSGGEYCNRLARLMKNWAFPVTGVKGFSHAQVTGGGVPLNEFVPETMSSRLVPGLFAAGEVLDVYGDCGGYNLHWAWTTGMLAGQGAVNA
jgi:predicted Rossmann fold flavoprotein